MARVVGFQIGTACCSFLWIPAWILARGYHKKLASTVASCWSMPPHASRDGKSVLTQCAQHSTQKGTFPCVPRCVPLFCVPGSRCATPLSRYGSSAVPSSVDTSRGRPMVCGVSGGLMNEDQMSDVLTVRFRAHHAAHHPVAHRLVSHGNPSICW